LRDDLAVVDLVTVLRSYSINAEARRFLGSITVSRVADRRDFAEVNEDASLREAMRQAINKNVEELVVQPGGQTLTINGVVKFYSARQQESRQ